ncbi:MAG: hypothetical protein JWN45_2857 [Acidobacteriaceae bacterium]|nr:hypothetical protein [Acidobacteriaceae bacterium]
MSSKNVVRSVATILILTMGLMISASAMTIPAGSKVTVRLGQSLSSERSRTGDSFDASLANDLVINGTTVAKAGAPCKGKVTYAKDSGRLHVPGALTIRLTSVDGQAVTSTARSLKGKSHTKSNATKIGGGAAAGALIGALAGGGKGAAIGAGVGAGAGTGVAAATGKQNVAFSAETPLAFTVTGVSK